MPTRTNKITFSIVFFSAELYNIFSDFSFYRSFVFINNMDNIDKDREKKRGESQTNRIDRKEGRNHSKDKERDVQSKGCSLEKETESEREIARP